MRRGSQTMSLLPLATAFLIQVAATGWFTVGLAPMIITTSQKATLSKSCVPAEVPKAVDRP